jgi:hypothetical protein
MRKIKKAKKLENRLNDLINDVEIKLQTEPTKKIIEEPTFNDDVISTVESSSRENTLPSKKGFCFKKKNPNFKLIKKSTEICSSKKEKSFFILKKEKNNSFSLMTKSALEKENDIGELTNNIKDQYEEDLIDKKTKMLLNAKAKAKLCKKEILKKRKNNESNFLIFLNIFNRLRFSFFIFR